MKQIIKQIAIFFIRIIAAIVIAGMTVVFGAVRHYRLMKMRYNSNK